MYLGRRLTMQTPGQAQVTYSYDAVKRLTGTVSGMVVEWLDALETGRFKSRPCVPAWLAGTGPGMTGSILGREPDRSGRATTLRSD